MGIHLDHVSILVQSIADSARKLQPHYFPMGEIETFQETGTEEVYIGPFEMNALLLLQAAIAEGPYQRAARKRGFGLHHIAIGPDDFEAYGNKLEGLGWHVHPESRRSAGTSGMVFYVRPGVRTIIELLAKRELLPGGNFITEVMINVDRGLEECIHGLGIMSLKCSIHDPPYLAIGDSMVKKADLG